MGQPLAVITGITGQDGSYLAELLLEAGREVVGFVRPDTLARPERLWRVAHLQDRLRLVPLTLDQAEPLRAAIAGLQPDECYHLAAVSFVSFDPAQEAATLEANVGHTHRLLAALREHAPQCRFCLAASCEIFGSTDRAPQDETAARWPRSVYGISKLAAFDLTRHYRETHSLHASSAILYNHESPRREPVFVSRKIAIGVARVLAGQQQELRLGNLRAQRDWGHAREYADAMRLMTRQAEPGDYVLATGNLHTVEDFARYAFASAGLDWSDYIVSDPALVRPESPVPLVGNAAKAAARLGWRACVRLPQLAAEMVEADVRALGLTVPVTAPA